LEGVWQEAVMAQFKVLSQHLPVGTEENHEKSQSGLLVPRLRFERRISRSRSQILAKYKTSISIMFNLHSSFYRLLQIKTTVLLQYTALLRGEGSCSLCTFAMAGRRKSEHRYAGHHVLSKRCAVLFNSWQLEMTKEQIFMAE
jgi:hypothetical protein